MLDTNIVSDLVRHPAGHVAKKIRKVGVDAICISVITAAELRFGCAKRASPRLTNTIEALLSELDVCRSPVRLTQSMPTSVTHSSKRANRSVRMICSLPRMHALSAPFS